MPSIKNLVHILTLILLSVPLFAIPANAQSVSPSVSGSSLCVASLSGCPANIENVPGGTITVAVVINNTINLNGFRLTVNYNSLELNALHVRGGNWGNGFTVLPVQNQTLQLAGTITVAQVLLGAVTNVTSATLISVDFGVKDFGSSNIALSNVALTGLVGGVITLLPTPTIVNGQMFTPPPVTATLSKSGISVGTHHLKLSSGNVQTLSAIVSNEGSTTAHVRVDYTIVSEAGDVTFVSTGVLVMPAGTLGTLSVSYTVPSLPIKYHVIGALQESGDGLFFVSSGSTDTTAYSVVP